MPALQQLVRLFGKVLMQKRANKLHRFLYVIKLLVEALALLRVVPAKLPEFVFRMPDRVVVLIHVDVVVDTVSPPDVDTDFDLTLATTVVPTLVGFGYVFDVTAHTETGATGHSVLACIRHKGGGTSETVESTLTVRAASSPPT